jgi:hypothetical protein
MIRSLEWAAGLFEGEGTITIRKRPEDQIALQLSSTDMDVVAEFFRVVGCGKVYGPYRYGPNRKPFWKWSCHDGATAASLLEKLLPFLGLRRSVRAVEAVQRWKQRQDRPHYTVSRRGMGGAPTHRDGGAAAIAALNGAEYVEGQSLEPAVIQSEDLIGVDIKRSAVEVLDDHGHSGFVPGNKMGPSNTL